MSKSLKILIGTLILAGAGHAVAASSVDLNVKGLITPNACRPSLSDGGLIDHGKISAKDLKPNNPTLIGTHTLTLHVNCEAAIAFALRGLDNRAGSSMSSNFGLGLINGDQKLGQFQITLVNPVADGVAVQPIASYDLGNTWIKEKFMEPDLYMSIATMADHSQPLPTKELVLDLRIQTVIYKTDGLDLSNEVPIDGSAVLEVKYL
ncbi:DUF1120 domain-containing protein [Pseudomonas trivialis]|uniref:DUF1120 domain-containing protein n=1 Tax=Pseudomonas trivialis TaxID=200450 RepID=UPI0030D3D3BC